MPDHQHDQIRELFRELDGASPPAPPMPDLHRRQEKRLPKVAVGLAVFLAILIVGLTGQFLLGGGDGDNAATDTTPPTTLQVETTTPEHAFVIRLLDAACSDFLTESSTEGFRIALEDDRSSGDYHNSTNNLYLAVANLTQAIRLSADASTDSELQQIATSADTFATDLELERGAVEPDASRIVYENAVAQVADLGQQLADYGATQCRDLEEPWPLP